MYHQGTLPTSSSLAGDVRVRAPRSWHGMLAIPLLGLHQRMLSFGFAQSSIWIDISDKGNRTRRSFLSQKMQTKLWQ